MAADGKSLVWLRGEVRTPPFSASARLEAGSLLRRLQDGEKLSMPHSRPMPSIGVRCHELRVVDAHRTWRIASRMDADAIVIADVFQKTTQQTPRHVVADCKRRLRLYDQVTREDYTMDAKKRKRLEAAGWTVGDTAAFLKLTAEESALVEMRLALSRTLRERRQAAGLTQTALAKQLGSSQSRVAKLEGGDASVSLELLIRALLSVGASRRDVAQALVRRVA